MTTEEKLILPTNTVPINQILRTYRNKENLLKSYLPGIHRVKQSSIQAQQLARDHSYTGSKVVSLKAGGIGFNPPHNTQLSLLMLQWKYRDEKLARTTLFNTNKTVDYKTSRLSIGHTGGVLSHNISPSHPILIQQPSIEPYDTLGSKPTTATNLQRKKPKGPNSLNIKVLEMWINDTILEAETGDLKIPQQKMVIMKSALKQFSVDRKTLKTKGISQENIDRMYRCLFVYSFGFYEMLYSIFNHAQDQSILIANIWKVYGILLEYCSRSDFQTTITVLENEKKYFITQLEGQIVRKEKQIAEMEKHDKEEQKRLKEDLKTLLLQRENLQIEKCQIEEDLKQADQAFHEELSLRLKFEHRINEIHSIHREVLAQHNRLLIDHQQLQSDNDQAQIELKEFKEKVIQLMNAKNLLEEEVRQKDLSLSHKYKEYQIIEGKIKQLSFQVDDKKLSEDTKVTLLKEVERNMEDLKFKSTNLQNQLSIHKKTIKDLEEQVADLQLDKEGQSLHIKEILKNGEQLRSRIFELEQSLVINGREIQNYKEKQEEMKTTHKKLDEQYVYLTQEKKQTDINLDFALQRITTQDSELKAIDQVILDMKIARNELEDQYVKIKVKLESTQEQLSQKSDLSKSQEIQLNNQHITNYKLQIELNSLKEQSGNEIEYLTKKLTTLQAQNKDNSNVAIVQQEELDKVKNKLLKLVSDNEMLRINNQNYKQNLTNQLFISDNNAQQINSLKQILESERVRIDSYLEQIGKLQIQNEQLSRDYKSLSFVWMEQQDNYESQNLKMQKNYSIEINKAKGDYRAIHIMQYEDLQSQLQRYVQKYQILYKNQNTLQEKYELEKVAMKQLAEEYRVLQLENTKINKQSQQRNQTINTLVLRQMHLSHLKEKKLMAEQAQTLTIEILKRDTYLQKQNIGDLETSIVELREELKKNQELLRQSQQKNIQLDTELRQNVEKNQELEKKLDIQQTLYNQLQHEIVDQKEAGSIVVQKEAGSIMVQKEKGSIIVQKEAGSNPAGSTLSAAIPVSSTKLPPKQHSENNDYNIKQKKPPSKQHSETIDSNLNQNIYKEANQNPASRTSTPKSQIENIDSNINFPQEINQKPPGSVRPPNPPKYQTYQPEPTGNSVPMEPQKLSVTIAISTTSQILPRQFSLPEESKQQQNADKQVEQKIYTKTHSNMERKIQSSGSSERDKKNLNSNAFSRQFQITSQYYSGIKKV